MKQPYRKIYHFFFFKRIRNNQIKRKMKFLDKWIGEQYCKPHYTIGVGKNDPCRIAWLNRMHNNRSIIDIKLGRF